MPSGAGLLVALGELHVGHDSLVVESAGLYGREFCCVVTLEGALEPFCLLVWGYSDFARI